MVEFELVSRDRNANILIIQPRTHSVWVLYILQVSNWRFLILGDYEKYFEICKKFGMETFFFEPVLQRLATGSLARTLLVDKVIFTIDESLQI